MEPRKRNRRGNRPAAREGAHPVASSSDRPTPSPAAFGRRLSRRAALFVNVAAAVLAVALVAAATVWRVSPYLTAVGLIALGLDRKSTRLNSSHMA